MPVGESMDFEALRQFVTVARTLHFGKAAEQLGMAQPQLSRVIARLEAELGTRKKSPVN